MSLCQLAWNGSVEARTWQTGGTGKPAKQENNLWDNSMAEPPREPRRSGGGGTGGGGGGGTGGGGGGGGGIPSRMEHWQGPPQHPDEWESNDEWTGKQMVFTNSSRQPTGADNGGAMLGTTMDPRQFKAVPDATPIPSSDIPSVIGMNQPPR